ncbi:hypothetical protein AB0M46_35390 [Dactylosporangium sp. NPDC051485]|uniref:hypothetical protein n=1 Tax=Dactylosporangium sp. NPDC051485 TaxID=3154846 RepID=UPI0034456526
MSFTLATRPLCAGTYLDANFCQRVLLDAYADRSRYVAPSYGFSLAQVAFHARRAWWLDTAQHVLVAFVVGIGALRSPLAIVLAGGVLMHWHVALMFGKIGGAVARYFREGPSIDRLSDIGLRLRLAFIALLVTWTVMTVSAVASLGYGSVASIWDDKPVAGSVTTTLLEAFADLSMVALVVVLFAAARQALLGNMLRAGEVSDRQLNRRMRHIAIEERSPVTYYADFGHSSAAARS